MSGGRIAKCGSVLVRTITGGTLAYIAEQCEKNNNIAPYYHCRIVEAAVITAVPSVVHALFTPKDARLWALTKRLLPIAIGYGVVRHRDIVIKELISDVAAKRAGHPSPPSVASTTATP